MSNLPKLSRRLHRSRTNRIVAGVLGGIAETYGWDANVLRLLFVLSWLLPGPQFILYFVAWVLMPDDNSLGF